MKQALPFSVFHIPCRLLRLELQGRITYAWHESFLPLRSDAASSQRDVGQPCYQVTRKVVPPSAVFWPAYPLGASVQDQIWKVGKFIFMRTEQSRSAAILDCLAKYNASKADSARPSFCQPKPADSCNDEHSFSALLTRHQILCTIQSSMALHNGHPWQVATDLVLIHEQDCYHNYWIWCICHQAAA